MKIKKNKKIALIIGVTGQDGSLLADFLIKKNYKVIGLKRRSSTFNTERINHLYTEKQFFKLHNKLKIKLQKKSVYFDDINFCPYHPNAKIKRYRKVTDLRKPGNLMVKQILNKWHVKLKNSFMIGDKVTDKMCAKKSKLYFEYANKNFYTQVKKIVRKI